jgi:1-acyl-sn-glycerol-3-phosphate acyltransferase
MEISAALTGVLKRRWPSARELLRRLQRAWFRLSVEGLEELPRSGPLLLAANHSGPSPFDAALILEALAEHRDVAGRPVAFVEQASMHGPHRLLFSGLDLRAGGPAQALEELRRGRAVVVFPEGLAGTRKTLWSGGKLGSFGRGGFVRVALLAGAPLVPVLVTGGEWAFPVLAELSGLADRLRRPSFPITPLYPWLGPLGRLPLPARWSVRFAPPMDQRQLGPGAADDDRVLEDTLGRLRYRLQAMLDGESGGNSSA